MLITLDCKGVLQFRRVLDPVAIQIQWSQIYANVDNGVLPRICVFIDPLCCGWLWTGLGHRWAAVVRELL